MDFFTPVVDDPEAYGAIAAANALSDVYAMGGTPLTALSIAAFPEKRLPGGVVGGHLPRRPGKLREAGCALLGGHTVRDPEIKFGYAITGLVEPDEMLTNAAGRPGDVVVLTKPLGTGVIATAVKAGQAPPRRSRSPPSARWPPRTASPAAVARRHGVRAATDITGFGLVGHAANVARESRAHPRDRAGRPAAAARRARALRARSSRRGLKANRRQFEPLVEDTAGAGRGAARAALRPADLGRPAPPRRRRRRRSALLADLSLARAIGRAGSVARPATRVRLGTRDTSATFLPGSRLRDLGAPKSTGRKSRLDRLSPGRSPMPSLPCARRAPRCAMKGGDGSARRYARALLDVALEKGDTAVRQDLDDLGRLYVEHAELRTRAPRIPPCPPRRRRGVIAALLRGRPSEPAAAPDRPARGAGPHRAAAR